MTVKLNLGCGSGKASGYINIDKSQISNADIFLDLEKDPLPYDNESIDSIRASHTLEHIWDLKHCLNECYRVLKKGGIMEIVVPNGKNLNHAFADPTHVRHFVPKTFRYLSIDFNVNMENYGFKKWGLKLLKEGKTAIQVEFIKD